MIPERMTYDDPSDDNSAVARTNMSAYFSHRRTTKHGKDTMQLPTERTVEAMRDALVNSKTVLLAGGPGGSFGHLVDNDGRFEHLISTHSNDRRDQDYIVPRGVGCVCISNLISIKLTKNIVQQCEYRKIPVFGVFKSAGGIKRAAEMAKALAPKPVKGASNGHHVEVNGVTANGIHYNNTNTPTPTAPLIPGVPRDEDLQREEQAAMRKLADVDRNLRADAPPAVQAAGATLVASGDAFEQQLQGLRALFTDVRAALDLAEEAVVTTMTTSRSGIEAQRRLAMMEAFLKGEK